MIAKNRRLLANFLLAVLISGGVVWLLANGYLVKSQNKLADRMFTPKSISGQIIIVAIDNQSIQTIGQWPWPRRILGEAISKIIIQSPRAVGIDINFSEPSRMGEVDDAALQAALKSDKIILPIEATSLDRLKTDQNMFYRANALLEPLARFAGQVKYSGHVNVFPDNDGVVRVLPTTIADKEKTIKAFALAVLDAAQIKYSLPKINAESLRINYFGPPGKFEYVSIKDVLQNKIDAKKFRDKIILLGATSADLHDTQITPISRGLAMPGVEIHANAAETVLQNKYLLEAGNNWTIGLIIFFALFNALLFSFFKKIYKIIGLALLFLIGYNIGALMIFDKGWILNLVHPNISFGISFVGMALYQYFAEGKEKTFLRQSFKQYLAPDVVEQIIANPENLKLGGQKKELTVLFSDIRGFTTISEKTSPEELVAFLNRYFTAMTDIVLTEQGVVDKFIGDAIMAFWGAPQLLPDHAERACHAALKMKTMLADFKIEWQKKGVDFNIGIGINTGEMLVGNMGSNQRFDYTVIGDNVNVASRLEGLNKEFKTNIIISESTQIIVKNISDFHFKSLGEVLVKGKTNPVKIFELF